MRAEWLRGVMSHSGQNQPSREPCGSKRPEADDMFASVGQTAPTCLLAIRNYAWSSRRLRKGLYHRPGALGKAEIVDKESPCINFRL